VFLYKIQIRHENGDSSTVVVMAENDEKAFSSAENQLDRHFVKPKKALEIAMIEKKRADKGSGYVIEQTKHD
jgi:hypothetical protein